MKLPAVRRGGRDIKAELRRSQPGFTPKSFAAVHPAIHPCSKLPGIQAKANKLPIRLKAFHRFPMWKSTLQTRWHAVLKVSAPVWHTALYSVSVFTDTFWDCKRRCTWLEIVNKPVITNKLIWLSTIAK